MVLLPCRHGVCASCYAAWDVECSVCRSPLPADGPATLVEAVVGATPSLVALARRLPFPAAAAERTVRSMLQANRCDAGAVEQLLYAIAERHATAAGRGVSANDDEAVPLLDAPEAAAAAAEAHPENAIARQRAVYAAARTPVAAAAAARRAAASALAAAGPPDTPAWLAARAALDAADHVLTEAREAAAASIYAAMNAGAAAGTDGTAEVVLDFHGLHAAEAATIVTSMLAPVLASGALRSLVAITGRGSHSVGGQGVLRDAVRDAAAEVPGLDALPVEHNGGRLRLVGERWGSHAEERR